MKIIVSGGTGFLGRYVVQRLVKEKHSIVLLSRSGSRHRKYAVPGVQIVAWDARTQGDWIAHIEDADAVMNLAGESIGGRRWTHAQKERILGSRVDATRAIVDALRGAKKRPSVLISASAVGYYGAVEDDEVTESRRRGEGFLAEVCEQWEKEATKAEGLGVRVVITRTGVVVGKGGGALTRMVLPFKMFVGGPIGSGKQWFPWIHVDDVAGILRLLLQNSTVSGPVNLVAPEAVTMKQFCTALGKATKRPSWAPIPAFVLKLALGEMSSMVLTGQRVVPATVTSLGYNFLFPKLDDALKSIFS